MNTLALAVMAGRRSPVSLAAWVRAILRRWSRRRRSRAELAGLDARELKDIGISRADAEVEANKPFWRN